MNGGGHVRFTRMRHYFSYLMELNFSSEKDMKQEVINYFIQKLKMCKNSIDKW